jgi:hypothetical protein
LLFSVVVVVVVADVVVNFTGVVAKKCQAIFAEQRYTCN